jgi:hypothetical protein
LAFNQTREEGTIAFGGFTRPGDVFDEHAFGTIHQVNSGSGTSSRAMRRAGAAISIFQRFVAAQRKPYEILSQEKFTFVY